MNETINWNIELSRKSRSRNTKCARLYHRELNDKDKSDNFYITFYKGVCPEKVIYSEYLMYGKGGEDFYFNTKTIPNAPKYSLSSEQGKSRYLTAKYVVKDIVKGLTNKDAKGNIVISFNLEEIKSGIFKVVDVEVEEDEV